MNLGRARRAVWVILVSLASSAACAALALFVVRGSIRHDLGVAVVVAIVYVVPLLALQAATEKPLRRWADASPFPSDWIVYGGAKLTIGLLAAGIGSALALLLGLVGRWQELYLANRLVVTVSVIAACMARLYSTTRSRLEERNRQLEEKVQAGTQVLRLHEEDFERAREIQQALMPKQLPRITGCQLAAGWLPARIVSGDYYDVIRLGNSSVAIAVGDVSGKGMAAALLMSNLQAIVHAFVPGQLAPHELCAKANQIIAANVAPGKYITFFYAVVDTARMRIDYCNAGHNLPILQHTDGTLETLGQGGPVLGVLPDAHFVSGFAQLQGGDCLTLFTDGLTEATNAADEEFGEKRLMDLFKQRSGGAEECHREVLAAVTQFSNGVFHDDVTLLIMTVD